MAHKIICYRLTHAFCQNFPPCLSLTYAHITNLMHIPKKHRLYVSRKESGREPASIGDREDASIRGLKVYIKKIFKKTNYSGQ